MNNEFLDLYHKWHNTFIFSAHGSADPKAKESYDELKKWSLENKKEALESIKEILLEEPNSIVQLLPEIIGEDIISSTGYIPLDMLCNLWLNILNNDIDLHNDDKPQQSKDYYKDYREFHEYMKDHYILWNPINEKDPNITLEEFKQGKRNKI